MKIFLYWFYHKLYVNTSEEISLHISFPIKLIYFVTIVASSFRLFDKQVQYEDACDKIKDLEQHVSNMKQTIEELEGDLANKNDDYDR